jgi:hypothetical protein
MEKLCPERQLLVYAQMWLDSLIVEYPEATRHEAAGTE